MFPLTAVFTLATPWFWPVVGTCAGVYLFYHGFCLLQRKRLIMNTPASKIRSAAMGLVEVSGLAAGPYTVNAPITGLPCYCYRTMVWQWKQQGKSSGWVKAADESMHLLFFLEDETGRVLVNPQGAEMDIHRDFHEEFSTSVFSSNLEIPGNISNFLLMHGVSTDKKVKIDEYCIKPKNALFILGTLTPNNSLSVGPTPVRTQPSMIESASFPFPFSLGASLLGSSLFQTKKMTFAAIQEGSKPEVFTQVSVNGKPAHALDPAQQARLSEVLTKAGITNPAAWAAAGIVRGTPAAPAVNVGGGTAAGTAPAPEQFEEHPPTVLMKGSHNPAFFISWRSQREVVKSLGWKSALMIWGGPALTLLCVYILAAEFGWR